MNATDTAKSKSCVRVLGVDPAAAGPTGYGIVEEGAQGYKILHYGAHRVGIKQQREIPGAVLREVHDLICRLIAEYEPDVMALESVFTALNMRTALRLAEVRGVILLAAAQHGLRVCSYAPREVKASVAGHGQADKRQMQVMVRALLAMTETPEPADAADALAVALCHFQAERLQRKFALPKLPVSRLQSVVKMAAQDSAIALNLGKGATRGARGAS